MSKREHSLVVGANDVEGSRTKRRREMASGSSNVDITHSDPLVPEVQMKDEGGSTSKEVIKEKGLKLWQTVKDAVNKEGRNISLDFLRKPSKRLYPDYYRLIQQPIALDDIKKQLDSYGYSSLEAIKQDFELCFNNAKHYNMKESDIWRDAKDLLKLVNKTYNKLMPRDEDGESDGDVEKKKLNSKAPNLNRLIKSRLQKLVDKTDNQGRIVSSEFMELPSKKDWPIYYKEIKRPQCLENIFKRIKRKEYHTSGEFAADVELVFSNAMAFNQEHTGIWEDARALRDNFRLLMSDLPSPFTLSEYAKPSNGKIKIKMPAAAQSSTSAATTIPAQAAPEATTTTPSLFLRVPGANTTKESKNSPAVTPVVNTISLPTTSTAPPSTPAPPMQPPAQPAQTSVNAQTANISPNTSFINTTFSHYPNAAYVPPTTTPSSGATSSTSNVLIASHQVPSTSSSTPVPPLHPRHQLKAVTLKTQPNDRTFDLDYRDGVKCWAMRLGIGENGLQVGPVTFLRDEEEESSGEEDEHGVEAKQEEEEEDAMEVDVPVKNGKKGKGKGRGRPKGTTKAAIAKAKAASSKKKHNKLGPVEVKLNGIVIKQEQDQGGVWKVDLRVGSNTVEVGETGGLIWKAYVERVDDA